MHPLEKRGEQRLVESENYYRSYFGADVQFAPFDTNSVSCFDLVDIGIAIYSSTIFQRLFAGQKSLFAPYSMQADYFTDKRIEAISIRSYEQLEFLIQENLLRTGNVSTIGKSEFRVIRESDDGVEYVPKLYIKGELSRSKAGYELLIIYESSGKKIKDTTVTFNEPVTFLQKVLPVLSASILAYKNVKMENKTPINVWIFSWNKK